MARTVGVLAAEHIAAGLVENDQIVGKVAVFPEAEHELESLYGLHTEEIAEAIADQIDRVRGGEPVDAVGVGFPGVIRGGVVEDSPNLKQTKGHNLAEALASSLRGRGVAAPVHVLNDADAVAAGVAARHGHLDGFIRVWTLGVGIGFGRYPQAQGVWEGGHTVVTLDPKEKFCGCGGSGHLEGIMGHRAMRLRFLDLEPEEVFERAAEGDPRCAEFMNLWHRALAAATATTVHMDGPGKFFVCGPNAHFVQSRLLYLYLQEMVKMSPLQDNSIEIVSTSDEVAIVGAAVSARLSARPA